MYRFELKTRGLGMTFEGIMILLLFAAPVAGGPIPGAPFGTTASIPGFVIAEEDNLDRPTPVVVLPGGALVNSGDVVLCEIGVNATNDGCVDNNVSDALRFFQDAGTPALSDRFQLFSEPVDPEAPLDLSKLPGGGLLANVIYILETTTMVDLGPGRPSSFPAVVYKAGPANSMNTYYILSDAEPFNADVPEPGTLLLFISGLAGLVIWKRKQVIGSKG